MPLGCNDDRHNLFENRFQCVASGNRACARARRTKACHRRRPLRNVQGSTVPEFAADRARGRADSTLSGGFRGRLSPSALSTARVQDRTDITILATSTGRSRMQKLSG